MNVSGQRGFTAMELAIVVTISAVLVPLVWSFSAGLEDQAALAQWRIDVADSVRTVTEELRLDARLGPPTAAVGFASPGCTATYAVTEAGLIRRGCGPDRGLAPWVASIEWAPGGVALRFERRLRPQRVRAVTVFVPVEAP